MKVPGVNVSNILHTTREGVKQAAAAALGKRGQVRAGNYRRAMLAGRVYWPGASNCELIKYHVCNNHPLLSCFLMHPQHPYSRKEHSLVLLTILSCQLIISIFMTEAFKETDETSADGTVVEEASETAVRVARFTASIVTSVIMAVVTAFLNFMAVCDDKFFPDSEGGWLKACCARIGHSAILSVTCVSVPVSIALVASIGEWSSGSSADTLTVFGLSLAQSWSYVWLATNVLLFPYSIWSQRRADAKAREAFAANPGRGNPPFDFSYEELVRWETEDIDAAAAAKAEAEAEAARAAAQAEAEARRARGEPEPPAPETRDTKEAGAAAGVIGTITGFVGNWSLGGRARGASGSASGGGGASPAAAAPAAVSPAAVVPAPAPASSASPSGGSEAVLTPVVVLVASPPPVEEPPAEPASPSRAPVVGEATPSTPSNSNSNSNSSGGGGGGGSGGGGWLGGVSITSPLSMLPKNLPTFGGFTAALPFGGGSSSPAPAPAPAPATPPGSGGGAGAGGGGGGFGPGGGTGGGTGGGSLV